jgi:hypothetical protein
VNASDERVEADGRQNAGGGKQGTRQVCPEHEERKRGRLTQHRPRISRYTLESSHVEEKDLYRQGRDVLGTPCCEG